MSPTQTSFLFDLLPLKPRQPPPHPLPPLLPPTHPSNRLQNLLLPAPNLLHRIPLPQRNTPILDRLKVHRNPQRRAQFVVARVPLADAGGRVVDFAGDAEAPEAEEEALDVWGEGGGGGEGDEEDFGGGDGGGKGEDL